MHATPPLAGLNRGKSANWKTYYLQQPEPRLNQRQRERRYSARHGLLSLTAGAPGLFVRDSGRRPPLVGKGTVPSQNKT